MQGVAAPPPLTPRPVCSTLTPPRGQRSQFQPGLRALETPVRQRRVLRRRRSRVPLRVSFMAFIVPLPPTPPIRVELLHKFLLGHLSLRYSLERTKLWFIPS